MRRLMYGLAIATVCTFAAVSGARVYAQAAKPPDTVALKGSPMGVVTLAHAKHGKEYGGQCVDCHHASKPAKPMKTEQQKCSDCHNKAAVAPMKTKNPFHDAAAKNGTCISCHTKAAAAGKKTPKVCTDCHKK